MPDDATLTPEEAATYLKVNPQTIYRNLRRGRLPGAKVGRQWRIRRSDLERLLAGASIAVEEVRPWPVGYRAGTKKASRDRQVLLQAELERFIREVVKLMKPLLIMVYGSFARGEVGEWSDLDLVDRPSPLDIEGLSSAEAQFAFIGDRGCRGAYSWIYGPGTHPGRARQASPLPSVTDSAKILKPA